MAILWELLSQRKCRPNCVSARERAFASLNKAAYGTADLAELAAAYAFGIARNHPFVDGNKRTALVASFTFLYLNGYAMHSTQVENVRTFLALASGDLLEDKLANWFRLHAQKL
ncbi:MAG: type II toxin-antitoxin system death-on-curing family toxin [Alphaproteobacteria bacterium]|nr:type II toxin-antitoxin system death-on-curing family toxin [Alphaproteobacteria bacterium]